MSDEVVSFDSALNKLRILSAERADSSNKIKEECLDFSTGLSSFFKYCINEVCLLCMNV